MRWREQFNQVVPAIPFVFLYDMIGGQNFDTTGAFHTWDTTKILTNHFTYSPDTDRIYLNLHSSGFYKITFQCCYDAQQGNAQAANRIYKNGVALDGALVCSMSVLGQRSTISLVYVVFLNYNDYIQINTTALDKSVNSAAESSRLLIEFIPQKGWNNNSGGRTDYTGQVMR